MTNKLYLPPKHHVPILEDPINFYYIPGFRWFFVKRLETVLSFVKNRHLGRVLDIGCGTGILFPEFAKRSDFIAGIDTFLQDYSIKGLCRLENITAHVAWGSILEIPFKDETFDNIVCISTLEHIEDSEKALGDIARTLRSGGKLLAGFPVQNIITNKLLGESTEFHVANHKRILTAAEKVFGKIKTKCIPSWAPVDLSLYCAFEAVKN